jgi:hypothetical protein
MVRRIIVTEVSQGKINQVTKILLKETDQHVNELKKMSREQRALI